MKQTIRNVSNSNLTGVNQICSSSKGRTNSWLWIIAILGLLLSIVALVEYACYSDNDHGFSVGVVVSILSLLVMILLGWNIFYALGIKDDFRMNKETTHADIEDLERRIETLEKSQQELVRVLVGEAIRMRPYAPRVDATDVVSKVEEDIMKNVRSQKERL